MRYKIGQGQSGLFDYQERKAALASKERGLDRLNAFVNWESFRPVLESRIQFTEKPKGGPRPWDLVLMLKILVLQKFHGLSDDETEFQILDRSVSNALLDWMLEMTCPMPKRSGYSRNAWERRASKPCSIIWMRRFASAA